jgi:hypothetical protein
VLGLLVLLGGLALSRRGAGAAAGPRSYGDVSDKLPTPRREPATNPADVRR